MFCASEKIQDDGEIVEKIDHFHFNNLGLLFWKDFSFLFICRSQISAFVIYNISTKYYYSEKTNDKMFNVLHYLTNFEWTQGKRL